MKNGGANKLLPIEIKGEKKMKKQDKMLDLLKRFGWERVSTPDGAGFRFTIAEREKEVAYNDCYQALGWSDALEIAFTNIWVQKEGSLYYGYIDF